jgi:hypothetical protein
MTGTMITRGNRGLKATIRPYNGHFSWSLVISEGLVNLAKVCLDFNPIYRTLKPLENCEILGLLFR